MHSEDKVMGITPMILYQRLSAGLESAFPGVPFLIIKMSSNEF